MNRLRMYRPYCKTHTIVRLCRENQISHRYLPTIQKYFYRTLINKDIQFIFIFLLIGAHVANAKSSI